MASLAISKPLIERPGFGIARFVRAPSAETLRGRQWSAMWDRLRFGKAAKFLTVWPSTRAGLFWPKVMDCETQIVWMPGRTREESHPLSAEHVFRWLEDVDGSPVYALDWRWRPARPCDDPNAMGESKAGAGAGSVVYFIREGKDGPIKIGFSRTSADSRLKALQTGNHRPLSLLAAMPGSLGDEIAMHRRFQSCRIGGEWFRPTSELMAFIAEVAQ